MQEETPINGLARVLGSKDESLSGDERQALIDEIEPQDGLMLVEEIREDSDIWIPSGNEANDESRFLVLKTGPGTYNEYTGSRKPMCFKKGDVISSGPRMLSWSPLKDANLWLIAADSVPVRYKQAAPPVDIVD